MQGFLEKYGITEDSNMLARGLPCFLKDHATGNEVEAEIVSRKSVLKRCISHAILEEPCLSAPATKC